MKSKVIIYALLILLLAGGCSQGREDLILGEWKVVEYSVSGNKYDSDRIIEFMSDGNYISYEKEDTINGEWRIRNKTLVLYQPELNDLHGNRLVEPFSRVWEVEVAEEWMLLEGTSRSNTQDMKLILNRQQ